MDKDEALAGSIMTLVAFCAHAKDVPAWTGHNVKRRLNSYPSPLSQTPFVAMGGLHPLRCFGFYNTFARARKDEIIFNLETGNEDSTK